MLLGAAGFFGFLAGPGRLAAAPTHPELAQDQFQRAKPGERGLQQVESHEGREPLTIRAMVMGQVEAQQLDRS
jgi:hypothetical protein